MRRLDAAASARTGVPHVREHVPERTLTTWVLLDVSPRWRFGTAARLKSDVAEGVAERGRPARGAAGRPRRAAHLRGDAPRLLPPRGGRSCPRGAEPRGRLRGGPRRAAAARGRAGRGPAPRRRGWRGARAGRRRLGLPGGRADRPWGRAIGALAARHDVLAVEVVDPREGELPDAGQLVARRPRDRRAAGGRHDQRRAAAALRGGRAARRDAVAAVLRRARAPARRRSPPTATGCASWAGACDELPGAVVPARPAGRAAGARRAGAGAPAPARATWCASRRCRRSRPSCRARRAGAGSCRPRCSAWRSPAWRSRSRGRR